MRGLMTAGAALLVLAAVTTAPTLAAAQSAAAPSRGTEAERSEIARILAADNIDSAEMMPADVVATMRAIPRGGAPADFWEAYRAHVAAWEQMAEAVTRVQPVLDAISTGAAVDDAALERAEAELVKGEAAVTSTFDEVERIATLYGVPLPAPRAAPVDLRGTV